MRENWIREQIRNGKGRVQEQVWSETNDGRDDNGLKSAAGEDRGVRYLYYLSEMTYLRAPRSLWG